MGREVRRVPPNWEHPKDEKGNYIPMHDETFLNAATWYQVYETVSEGTPVTPPFSNKEELIDYLVNVGDYWDGKHSREAATAFVAAGWAPSMIIKNGKIISGIDSALV